LSTKPTKDPPLASKKLFEKCLVAYGIREMRPTAHAVIPAVMLILASDRALTPSSIDAPVVIRSSIK